MQNGENHTPSGVIKGSDESVIGAYKQAWILSIVIGAFQINSCNGPGLPEQSPPYLFFTVIQSRGIEMGNADASRKTILVTGGAGYIGSHTCKLLAAQGYFPVTFDNLIYGHEWAVKWGPLEKGDLLDRARIAQVISHYRPEAVVHFAAYCYVGESVEKPGKYYENNVYGTLNLLEAMIQGGVKDIVFSSTCATYGVPEEIPIPETHPQRPINPYGATKLMVERILEDFEAAHGLRSVALRYFNAAGADPDGEIGEDHNPETHLIPIVLDAALGRRAQIAIYGDDYDTPDGTCIRDYIHIVDLGDAHIRSLKHLQNGGESLRLNLGNGQGYSVREVIDLARKVTGRPIKEIVSERRPGDPPRLIGVSKKARATLGWNPRFGDLETIIRHAWNWQQKVPVGE
jgi:UDP-arabinose 4-epimerase